MSSERKSDESQAVESSPKKQWTDEDMINLVKDRYVHQGFSGAFAGISTLQREIMFHDGVHIPQKLISRALQQLPVYLQHLRPIRRFQRGRYTNIRNYAYIAQSDVAVMPEYNCFRYFVLYIELFSRCLYVYELQRKGKDDIIATMKDFLSRVPVQILQTDQGTEFTSTKAWLKERGTFLSLKTGDNKASFAEQAIGTVKRRLYRSLRQSRSKDWVSLLKSTVDAINSTHTARLGYLMPKQVDMESEPFVRQAQKAAMSRMTEKQREELFPPLDDYLQQQEAIRHYDDTASKQLLKPGTFCLLDLPSKQALIKSFDLQRGRIYVISEVLSNATPLRYKLNGLQKESIPGSWYAASLRISPEDPDKIDYWDVDYIKQDRMINRKKMYLVHWQHYPSSYDSWLPAKNLKPGSIADYLNAKKKKSSGQC